MTATIVTSTIAYVGLFPLIIGSSFIFIGLIINCNWSFVFSCINIISHSDFIERDVTGQGTEVVHDAVDTEIVAVHDVVSIRIASGRIHLVQRYLTDTVDGVVGVVYYLRHTVLSTLHHHTAAKDTAEVSTLDGIHDTSGIDGYDTIFLPNGRVGHLFATNGDKHAVISYQF